MRSSFSPRHGHLRPGPKAQPESRYGLVSPKGPLTRTCPDDMSACPWGAHADLVNNRFVRCPLVLPFALWLFGQPQAVGLKPGVILAVNFSVSQPCSIICLPMRDHPSCDIGSVSCGRRRGARVGNHSPNLGAAFILPVSPVPRSIMLPWPICSPEMEAGRFRASLR